MSAAEEWEEYAAAYLEKHPEISAAIPQWAEEVEFSVIDDDYTGVTEFHFTRTVGMVRLWGSGSQDANGVLDVDTAPDLLIDGEINTTSIDDAVNTALTLSVNLQNVISILTTQSRPLRRPVDVDEHLREFEG
ncbi:MAG: hypothetical protein ACTMIY_09825 [Microbacterium gubbeenense]